ncbi:unnamed protein product [Coccothraustes coccothraustes]
MAGNLSLSVAASPQCQQLFGIFRTPRLLSQHLPITVWKAMLAMPAAIRTNASARAMRSAGRVVRPHRSSCHRYAENNSTFLANLVPVFLRRVPESSQNPAVIGAAGEGRPCPWC